MPIVIDLSLTGTKDLRGGFQAISKEIRDFRNQIAGLKSTMAQPARGGAAQGIASVRRQAQAAQGPLDRLNRAYQNLQKNPNSFDARFGFGRARRAYHNAWKQVMQDQMTPDQQAIFGKGGSASKFSQMSNLGKAAWTTRVGVGANGLQIQPLVGRLITAIGPAAEAFGVAAGGVMLLAQAAKTAADHVNGFAARRAALGTTPERSGQLERMGGVSGVDIDAAARRVHEAATGGGYGSQVARRAGMNIQPGPYGEQDYAKQLIEAVRYISRLQGDDQTRQARALGIEDLIPYINARGPAGIEQDLNIGRSRDKGRAADLWLNEASESVSSWFKDELYNVTHPSEVYGSPWRGAGGAPAAARATADAAQDKNTAAIVENTRVMRDMREVISRGRRANASIPMGWRWMMLDEAMRTGAVDRLGAF